MFDVTPTLIATCILVGVSGCGGGGGGVAETGGGAGGISTPGSNYTSAPPPANWQLGTGAPPLAEAPPTTQPPPTGSSPQDAGGDEPTPPATVAPYDPGALPVIGGEPSLTGAWPAWRKSMSRWEWRHIPGSDLSSVAPNPAVPGALSARIDAWNGLAADTRTNRLYSAANGGHADYAGNEVYEIDLSVDAPKWKILRGPTPTSEIVASNASQGIYHDYYLDGRPASTHTYYALNFLASRNAIFKFGAGSVWGTGNEGNWNTDAFSLATNDWYPANTWPNGSPGDRGGAIAASICKDPRTEQVYLATRAGLRRFEPSSGTFTTLSSWIQNSSAVYARGCAVDVDRNRVIYFGDAYRAPSGGLVFDIESNELSQITFTGAGASEVTKASYNFAWYEPKVGVFLLKTRDGGTVYSIDPATLTVQPVATAGGDAMPDAANGVHTRWQRLPNLGGYAYYPRHGSGVWFLAIE